jgi:hypothetical protein
MPNASGMSSERASAILRKVPVENAFFFYRAIDSPTNISARSLREFLERIATIEAQPDVFMPAAARRLSHL